MRLPVALQMLREIVRDPLEGIRLPRCLRKRRNRKSDNR